jgi:tetratricopeptide (TPR) repeat protein
MPIVHWLGILLASAGGDYADAEARAQALRAESQANADWRGAASSELADLGLVRGRLVDAERHLRDALEAKLEAGSFTARWDWAVSVASLHIRHRNDTVSGLAVVDSTFRRYPLDSIEPSERPYLQLATIYALAGRTQKSRTLLTEFESLVKPQQRHEDEAARHVAWGELAMAEGRYEDAIAEFRNQRETECRTCGLAQMGRAYDRLGRHDSATTIYERYVTTPDFFRIRNDANELPGTYRRLAELYEYRGNPERAREYYSRYVKLWANCDPALRPRLAEARERLANAN